MARTSKAVGFDGAEEYRQAVAIVERLFKQTSIQCPDIEDTPFSRTAEAWFVWGLFTAMTGSDQHSETLLRIYLHKKHGLSYADAAVHARCIGNTANLDSPLFHAVARCGSDAYRDNNDTQLVEIVQMMLKAMTMEPLPNCDDGREEST